MNNSVLFLPGTVSSYKKRGRRISHLIAMLFLYRWRPRWNEPAFKEADLTLPEQLDFPPESDGAGWFNHNTQGLSSLSGFNIGRQLVAKTHQRSVFDSANHCESFLYLDHSDMLDWIGSEPSNCVLFRPLRRRRAPPLFNQKQIPNARL